MDISVFHQVSLFDFLRIRLGLTVVVFLWGSVSASYQNNLGSTQDFATLNWFYWQTSLTLSYWLKWLDAIFRFLFFCSHSLWNATWTLSANVYLLQSTTGQKHSGISQFYPTKLRMDGVLLICFEQIVSFCAIIHSNIKYKLWSESANFTQLIRWIMTMGRLAPAPAALSVL